MNNMIWLFLFFLSLCGKSKLNAQNNLSDNFVVTTNSNDVSNLMKVGDGESTKIGLLLPSQEKLYKKAIDDLKKQAAKAGANLIYIKRNEFTQQPNVQVHLVAEFYKQPVAGGVQSDANQSTSNMSENLITNINSGIDFTITGCTGDAAAQTVTVYFAFSNPRKADHSISVSNGFYSDFSTAFDNDGNQYPFKELSLAGTTSTGNVSKELPTGLTLKGSITFSNVLNRINAIAVAKIPASSSNWNVGGDNASGMIIVKNVKVNWNGTEPQPPINSVDTKPVWNTTVKNLNNGIDFSVADCKGDASAQTVTIFFTFLNPRKSNQNVSITNGFYSDLAMAFDNEGSQYPFKSLSLAESNGSGYISKELPTGLTLKGSITFSNVLQTVAGFAVAKIPVSSSNWDGGANQVSGMIEVKNIAINWGNLPASVANPSKSTGVYKTGEYLTYNDLLNKLNTGTSVSNKKIILDNIYFKTNEANITDDSKTTLQNVLKLLIKYPKLKITILGHTDNVGREDDNLDLSTGRAKAVLFYLVSKGIDRDRLFYKGFGSTQPIADNSTDEGKTKNRRTEMEIMEQ